MSRSATVEQDGPCDVYVVGHQVMMFPRDGKRHSARKLELTDAERERLEQARNSYSMPRDVWDDAGLAHDARVMRRTS